LQSLETLFDVTALKVMGNFLKPSVRFFSQHRSQKAADYLASDVLIALVIYRPCLQHGFGTSEDLFYLPEFLVVLDRHLFRG